MTRASEPDHNTLSYPLRPFICERHYERRNIIVILIDSWRFDQLEPNVTPNLAALADRSVRFANHYSGSNATRMGVFSLYCSTPSPEFAIMQTDRVAVINKFGLQLRGTDYSRHEGALDARVIAAVLEQGSRFH